MTKTQALREIGLTESEIVEAVMQDEMISEMTQKTKDTLIRIGLGGVAIGGAYHFYKENGRKKMLQKIVSPYSNATKEFGRSGAVKYGKLLAYSYEHADSDEEKFRVNSVIYEKFLKPISKKYKISAKCAGQYLSSTKDAESYQMNSKCAKID